jgi:hypothetical protein
VLNDIFFWFIVILPELLDHISTHISVILFDFLSNP